MRLAAMARASRFDMILADRRLKIARFMASRPACLPGPDGGGEGLVLGVARLPVTTPGHEGWADLVAVDGAYTVVSAS